MFTRKSWFLVSCSLASALALFAFAPTRALADVSVSYDHVAPPPYVVISYDKLTYQCSVSGMPWVNGWALKFKVFGQTEPAHSTDSGSETNIDSSSGSLSMNKQMNFSPNSEVQDGTWIAYHIHGVLSDGSGSVDQYTGWYEYYSAS